MTLPPLLFGYVRLREPGATQHVPRLRKQLRDFAIHEGYTLAEVLVEHDRGGSSAFAGLLDLIKRYPGSRAVVPSLDHLAELPGVRQALVALIQQETGCPVLVVDEAAS
jgi:hypothetical protein